MEGSRNYGNFYIKKYVNTSYEKNVKMSYSILEDQIKDVNDSNYDLKKEI